MLALAGTAQAQIFRCEGPNGVVEYTNAPPAGPQAGRTCKTVDATITVIPAPKAPVRAAPPPAAAAPASGGAATGAAGTAPKPAASPDGFPKVDPATQRTRDSDRRRILEDELKKEEARLAEIQKEYNGGEPERRGDERNYQKYLDRVQRLKEDIQRTEGNLATIRRELAALK
ncbi:MAG: DUF4124 domain-containing protein [Burkholderiaceae bacterium]|nr:DUF4124 domain-containing protein [Burkholderiaceae bacterium]